MTTNQRLKKIAKLIPRLRKLIFEYEKSLVQIELLQTQVDKLFKQNQKLKQKLTITANKKKDVVWPLFKEELLKVEVKQKLFEKKSKNRRPPFKLNWVVLGANLTSGGQEDIFRTIQFLSDKGHDCHIYIYDVRQNSDTKEQEKLIHTRYPNLKVGVSYNLRKMRDCDAIFATHWVTAYPVYNFRGEGKKYYYVQDFEPFFEPAGYLNYLAERTYSFGFRGLTLGKWLSEKLSQEYNMQCDYFDFGYDTSQYYETATKRGKDVLYYMRPLTARRGVELAMMALELFHKQCPKSRIHLFGANTDQYNIAFPHVNHGVLSISQLNKLYNQCAAGLVLSFTNMSLIPLEMIAAGCVPVVNDSYHTRKVEYADSVVYAAPHPQTVALALAKTVQSAAPTKHHNLNEFGWDASNQKIENMLVRDLS